MAISGGPPRVLATALAGRGGSWGSNGAIIYAPDAQSPLQRVNVDGTGAALVTQDIRTAEDQSHRWPIFLPDGTHFIFWAGNFGNLKDDRSSGIYVSSLEGKERKLVALCHSSFGYDAHNLYYADEQRQLVSVAFDTSAGTVSGSTTVIANAVGYQPSTYWSAFTVAPNGTLIYNISVGAAQSALTWMDRSGKELGHISDPAIMDNPTLSPDGGRVAVDISDQKANNVDIWIESTTGAGNSRFTFDPSEEVVGCMVARWKHRGLPRGYRQRLESFLEASDWPGTREEYTHYPDVVDGRRYSEFLVFGRQADSVHTSDCVRQPSGIAAGRRRGANPVFDQQGQRKEWTDFSRWKVGGLCLR
jgi:hypothetical protein